MRYLIGFMFVLALGVTGCGETKGTGGTGGMAGTGGTGGTGGVAGTGGTGGIVADLGCDEGDCVEDDTLAAQCETFVKGCIAAEPGNEDQCIAAGLLLFCWTSAS